MVDRAGLFQFDERGGECGMELLRLDRIEHGADLIVARDPVHREQGLAVGPSLARRQMPLMGQEGWALHEERGKCGHAEVGHGVGGVLSLPLVGDRQATAANGSNQAVRGGHRATESTKPPRRKPPSAYRGRFIRDCCIPDSVWRDRSGSRATPKCTYLAFGQARLDKMRTAERRAALLTDALPRDNGIGADRHGAPVRMRCKPFEARCPGASSPAAVRPVTAR